MEILRHQFPELVVHALALGIWLGLGTHQGGMSIRHCWLRSLRAYAWEWTFLALRLQACSHKGSYQRTVVLKY